MEPKISTKELTRVTVHEMSVGGNNIKKTGKKGNKPSKRGSVEVCETKGGGNTGRRRLKRNSWGIVRGRKSFVRE